ncbi:DUF5819 family protein [Streptomyces sp. DSM 41982]|uniref:DUF5819 family protein n=2 Tax=Streptomyces TaxID=1883 RepID=A0ABD5EGS7_9ACTN|nr:DUF5819 family protein [Streptomyces sp. DSM 41982]MDT0419415.1 DUF5819 family protein [Streptomyces sp. DSM 41982]
MSADDGTADDGIGDDGTEAGGTPAAGGQDPRATDPTRAPAPDAAPVPDAASEPDAVPAPDTPLLSAPATGLAALSLPFRVVGALALAAVLVLTGLHLSFLFLHVAPANTVSTRQAKAVNAWIYPEFEQNWKLFAPNPIQQNTTVQARASGLHADGTSFLTGWYDLSARDGAALHGEPLPSHTRQNVLRRAWDLYASSHDDDGRPVGTRGELSAAYLTRLATQRLERAGAGGPGAELTRIRVRARFTPVPPPPWSGEKLAGRPAYRTLDWAEAHR